MKRRASEVLSFKDYKKRRLSATDSINRFNLAKTQVIRSGYDENKYIDQEVNASTLTTTWTGGEHDPANNCLNAVSQGDGESSRDGRKYVIKSVHIRGYISRNVIEGSVNPNPDEIATIALVLDTQTNSNQLNAEDVMADATTITSPFTFRNLEYSQRFRVLKYKMLKVPIAQTSTYAAANNFNNPEVKVPFSMNVSFPVPIKVICNGTTAGVSDISDNSLHIIACGTSTGLAITYASRVRFVG